MTSFLPAGSGVAIASVSARSPDPVSDEQHPNRSTRALIGRSGTAGSQRNEKRQANDHRMLDAHSGTTVLEFVHGFGSCASLELSVGRSIIIASVCGVDPTDDGWKAEIARTGWLVLPMFERSGVRRLTWRCSWPS
jgi:hypothetical protein